MCAHTICSRPLCATLAKETESAARLAARLSLKINASDDDLTMSEIRTHRHSLLVKLEVHMDTLSSSPIARSCFGRPSSLGAVLRGGRNAEGSRGGLAEC